MAERGAGLVRRSRRNRNRPGPLKAGPPARTYYIRNYQQLFDTHSKGARPPPDQPGGAPASVSTVISGPTWEDQHGGGGWSHFLARTLECGIAWNSGCPKPTDPLGQPAGPRALFRVGVVSSAPQTPKFSCLWHTALSTSSPLAHHERPLRALSTDVALRSSRRRPRRPPPFDPAPL